MEIMGNIGGGIGLYYGKQYENKRGVKFKILEYVNRQKVKIVFEEPFVHTKWVEAKHIRNGFSIRSPYEKLILGVGCLGEGVYNSKNSADAYSVWHNMLKRCYSKAFQGRHPSYVGCTVCEEWLNFQVFAEWYYNHESYGFGYDLDKDLLVDGNRVYSPEFCCMLPKNINTAISKQGSLDNGFPIGVKRDSLNRFRADCSAQSGSGYIGCFTSIEDAHKAYVKVKKQTIIDLAEKWKYLVAVDVYESLKGWEV